MYHSFDSQKSSKFSGRNERITQCSVSSISVRVVSGWSWLKFKEDLRLFEEFLYSMLLMSAKIDKVAVMIVMADRIRMVKDFCGF